VKTLAGTFVIKTATNQDQSPSSSKHEDLIGVNSQVELTAKETLFQIGKRKVVASHKNSKPTIH
jgi:hypothetical protein